jgi:hypothetical protein
MCDCSKSCVFYSTYNKHQLDSKLHQLLVATYCEGDLQDVCRRKRYEEETGITPQADFGPNGYSIKGQNRIY